MPTYFVCRTFKKQWRSFVQLDLTKKLLCSHLGNEFALFPSRTANAKLRRIGIKNELNLSIGGKMVTEGINQEVAATKRAPKLYAVMEDGEIIETTTASE